MRRTLIAGLVAVSLVVAIPFAGYLTARNAIPNLCGTGDFAFQGAGPVPVSNPGATFEARVATWNVAAANSTGRVIAGLRAVGRSADIIGVQELHPESRRHAAERALKAAWGFSAGDNAAQILWRRSRYERLAGGSEKVFDLERIENGVSGVSIGPKSVQWLQLRDRSTGAVIFVANHHIVPSIDSGGHPDSSNPKRLALYDRQMTAMLGVVAQLRRYGPVFTTGDLNVDERRDSQVKDPRFPFARMGAAGLVSNWQALGYPSSGTHNGGPRLIDSVWATTATARFVSQRILPNHGSDHRPAVVVARNTGAGSPAPAAAAAAVTATAPSALPDRLTVPGPTQESSMELRGEQVSIAAEIIAQGKAQGIPPQGWVVALAAALQESGIRDLNYGDRDSRGPFQQRPSSGWGTVEQVTNVALSVQAFYGVATHTRNPGLVDIHGWQDMPVTEAAQAVQRSGFPSAYAKWEAAARSIVQQIAGSVAGASDQTAGCGDTVGVDGHCPPTGLAAETGLTPDALLVIRCGHEKFPAITSFGGVHPDPLPDHPSGRAVDFLIPNYQTAEGKAYGWQVARWMRANHLALGVEYVIFDAHIWNVLRDDEGWRPYSSVTGSINDSSMHYNHVHVTVFGTKGTGPVDSVRATPGRWVMPLPAGTYTVGCSVSCYAGHTGQDFPVTVGTEVRSSNAGLVIRSEALRNRRGAYVSYGNVIVVKADDKANMTIWYAHLSARTARVGDRVTAGQVIGASGNTGNSRGPHLHYEIRVNGTPTDPMTILRQNGVTP